MPFTTKYRLPAMLFCLFLTTLPLFVGIYFSDPDTGGIFQGVSRKKAELHTTPGSRVSDDKVLLLKDSGLIVNNCRLVYKGYTDKMIHLDIYLLELDPKTPYPRRISKPEAVSGVRLGDSEFRLLSVNRQTAWFDVADVYRAH